MKARPNPAKFHPARWSWFQQLFVAVEEELSLKIFPRLRGGLKKVAALLGKFAQKFFFVFSGQPGNDDSTGRS